MNQENIDHRRILIFPFREILPITCDSKILCTFVFFHRLSDGKVAPSDVTIEGNRIASSKKKNEYLSSLQKNDDSYIG